MERVTERSQGREGGIESVVDRRSEERGARKASGKEGGRGGQPAVVGEGCRDGRHYYRLYRQSCQAGSKWMMRLAASVAAASFDAVLLLPLCAGFAFAFLLSERAGASKGEMRRTLRSCGCGCCGRLARVESRMKRRGRGRGGGGLEWGDAHRTAASSELRCLQLHSRLAFPLSILPRRRRRRLAANSQQQHPFKKPR